MGKVTKKNNAKSKSNQKVFKNNDVKSRKDIRKEKRNLKKANRRAYHNTNKKNDVGKFVRMPQSKPEVESDSISGSDSEPEMKPVIKNKKKDSPMKFDRVTQEIMDNKRAEQKLKDSMNEQRKKQLLKANEEEDKIIKKLEKQLKLKKKKPGNVTKSFESDGLDYLLEVCDESTMEAAIAAEKHLVEDDKMESDFDEDLAIATGQDKESNKTLDKKKKTNNKSVMETESFDEDDDFGDEIDDSDSDDIDNELNDDGDLSDEDENLSDEEEDASDDDMNNKSDNELTEEEIQMLYKGVSEFPDGIFRPGSLPAIREERESDLDSKKNDNHSDVDIDEHNMSDDENSSEPEDSELIDSDEMDESDLVDSEFDDSESIESSNDDFEMEEENNKQIIVNGKVVNTYGREVAPTVDDDFERCPKLDKILANISDSDIESKCSKNAANNSVNSLNQKSDKSNIEDERNSTKKKRKKDDMADVDITQINKKLRKDDSGKNTKSSNKNKIIENPFSSDDELSDSDFEATSVASKTNKKNQKFHKDESCTQKKAKVKSNKNEIIENPFSSDDELSNSDFEAMSVDDINKMDEQIEKKNFNEEWEDIYGRKRDKEGNVVEAKIDKYIPPHMRVKDKQDDSIEAAQLKRQIKGFLNKVAGSNMHWTSTQIENVYNSHSRNSVNNAFCSLWMEAIIQPVITNDRLAIEHAMLIAILHANIGSEIGAHFLQTLSRKFNDLIVTQSDSKELENLVLGLSHLYNFKIFQAALLYEILNKLVDDLSEKHVDCILVALRNVGGVLRKDDPMALKGFIHNIQEKAGKLKNQIIGSRINFLLDVLLAIKNNNLNKIPNYDPAYSEEMKKAIRGIIRRGNSVVPLNIKLNDLLNADEKGRWWIVGSAWDGSENKKSEAGSKDTNVDKQNSYLLKLADSQRINTDLRRNIFCIIMSAEDYEDAFEKLQHLGLKNQQEREIIHVLISCCLQEKTYNPYYSVLAQKYCVHDRKFQMSIQYCVWDKLREIESCSMFQIKNLGQFLTHLFVEMGLPISVLKVIEFSSLTKSTLRLMRQILLGILLHKDPKVCLEVFHRVALSPKLHLFRESLRLFISHFLLKNTDSKSNVLSNEQLTLLKERSSLVERILQVGSKFKL